VWFFLSYVVDTHLVDDLSRLLLTTIFGRFPNRNVLFPTITVWYSGPTSSLGSSGIARRVAIAGI